MNLFELRNTLTIKERRINGIPLIKTNIESQLNALKARTNVSENVIDFKTIPILYGTTNPETNPILLRIYKEGRIIIDKQKELLIIGWSVKLDTLYAVALSIASILTIVSSFVTVLVYSIIFGIAIFLAVAFAGIIYIRLTMDNLIISSVYRK
jgi:hypothetical protein